MVTLNHLAYFVDQLRKERLYGEDKPITSVFLEGPGKETRKIPLYDASPKLVIALMDPALKRYAQVQPIKENEAEFAGCLEGERAYILDMEVSTTTNKGTQPFPRATLGASFEVVTFPAHALPNQGKDLTAIELNPALPYGKMRSFYTLRFAAANVPGQPNENREFVIVGDKAFENFELVNEAPARSTIDEIVQLYAGCQDAIEYWKP